MSLVPVALAVAALLIFLPVRAPQSVRAALAVIAVPDVLSMKHDRTAVVPAPGVLGNDLYLLGSTTASLASKPSYGTVDLRSDGGYTYVPNASYVGTDVFRYRPSGLLSTTSTVTITITNAPPVAVPDSYFATAGVTRVVGAPGVLANDVDADGDALTATLMAGVTHGSLTLGSSGGFSYTANSGYSGADSFTYRAGDGISWSLATTVALLVSAPAPTPTPTATPTPRPVPTPSPTPTPTPGQSLPASGVPTPSLPLPSLPIPTLPVPTLPVSRSPAPSLAVPSLPIPTPITSPEPSPSSSASSSAPQSGGSGPGGSGPGGTSGPSVGGPPAAGGQGAASASAPEATSGSTGPGGLGVRTRAGGSDQLTIGSFGLGAGLQLWLVPAAAIAGPGLLVILWLVIQVAAGTVWLPAARRVRGDERRRRRPAG